MNVVNTYLSLYYFLFKVDAINSVQFSNHTGYAKGVRGQVKTIDTDNQTLSH